MTENRYSITDKRAPKYHSRLPQWRL